MKKRVSRRAHEAEKLYEALGSLLRAYRNRDRERPCYFDISISECTTLEEISRNGPMTVNDLASALHLDKSNASRITKSLERKNYVRRAPDGRDGRVLRVTATRPGRDLDTSIRDGIIARQQAVLSRFPPEVRRAAPRLLEELAANVMGRSN